MLLLFSIKSVTFKMVRQVNRPSGLVNPDWGSTDLAHTCIRLWPFDAYWKCNSKGLLLFQTWLFLMVNSVYSISNYFGEKYVRLVIVEAKWATINSGISMLILAICFRFGPLHFDLWSHDLFVCSKRSYWFSFSDPGLFLYILGSIFLQDTLYCKKRLCRFFLLMVMLNPKFLLINWWCWDTGYLNIKRKKL